jgi:SnoaL-like polyketide cyclase
MQPVNAVDIVHDFWSTVWNPPYDLEAIDRFVVEDFVITSGGEDIVSRAAFKEWVAAFQSKIVDMRLEPVETFENADGSRVASRWVATGRNNGMLGTAPDQEPIRMTGTAVWAVREDGKLLHNWVERNAWEVYLRLTADPRTGRSTP